MDISLILVFRKQCLVDGEKLDYEHRYAPSLGFLTHSDRLFLVVELSNAKPTNPYKGRLAIVANTRLL